MGTCRCSRSLLPPEDLFVAFVRPAFGPPLRKATACRIARHRYRFLRLSVVVLRSPKALKASCHSGVVTKAGPPAASGSGDELPSLRLASCNLKSDDPQQSVPSHVDDTHHSMLSPPSRQLLPARKQQRDTKCMLCRCHSKASTHLAVRDERTSLKSKERLQQQSTASAQNSARHLPLHLLAWGRTARRVEIMISTIHRLCVLSSVHTLPSCGWKAASPLMPSSRSDLMMKCTFVCSSARTARNINENLQKPCKGPCTALASLATLSPYKYLHPIIQSCCRIFAARKTQVSCGHQRLARLHTC